MTADDHIRAVLEELMPAGTRFDPETPSRYVAALRELLSGYSEDPASFVRSFDADGYDQVVAVNGIPFASLCEHHVLPFTGTVSAAYLPRDHIIGLSKIPRIVRAVTRRLQVQERMTHQIAEALQNATDARAVAVRVRGRHSCMSLRGVRAEGEMVTSVVTGIFREAPGARAEALDLLA